MQKTNLVAVIVMIAFVYVSIALVRLKTACLWCGNRLIDFLAGHAGDFE